MAHRCVVNVRFNELDPNNHVNHGVYVTYFEVGRSEALKWCGIPLEEMVEKDLDIFVTSIDVEYKAPASAGERLVIETSQGEQTKRATTQWSQRILRAGEVLATARVVAAAVNLEGKPVRPPSWLSSALEKLGTDDIADPVLLGS